MPAIVLPTDAMIPAVPWPLFKDWVAYAVHHEPSYPEAMTLATVGADGMPAARTVLMKEYDARGIVFYTNRESRKGRELAVHAKASVCFYWKSLQRQVRIEGTVSLLTAAEDDAYFATRPRGSQLGAWASRQSQKLASREELERAVDEVEKKYHGQSVPRPPHWGGYRLAPSYFEFWAERRNRLHDRITYTRSGDTENWVIERLYP